MSLETLGRDWDGMRQIQTLEQYSVEFMGLQDGLFVQSDESQTSVRFIPHYLFKHRL